VALRLASNPVWQALIKFWAMAGAQSVGSVAISFATSFLTVLFVARLITGRWHPRFAFGYAVLSWLPVLYVRTTTPLDLTRFGIEPNPGPPGEEKHPTKPPLPHRRVYAPKEVPASERPKFKKPGKAEREEFRRAKQDLANMEARCRSIEELMKKQLDSVKESFREEKDKVLGEQDAAQERANDNVAPCEDSGPVVKTQKPKHLNAAGRSEFQSTETIVTVIEPRSQVVVDVDMNAMIHLDEYVGSLSYKPETLSKSPHLALADASVAVANLVNQFNYRFTAHVPNRHKLIKIVANTILRTQYEYQLLDWQAQAPFPMWVFKYRHLVWLLPLVWFRFRDNKWAKPILLALGLLAWCLRGHFKWFWMCPRDLSDSSLAYLEDVISQLSSLCRV